MKVLLLCLGWFFGYVIDALAGVILLTDKVRRNKKRNERFKLMNSMLMRSHDYNTHCVKCLRRARSALIILLILVGTLIWLLTGCGTTNPNTGVFTPPSWLPYATNGLPALGAAAAPITGGLSIPASTLIASLLASIFGTGGLIAQRQSVAKSAALTTVNTAILAHPQASSILTAVQLRANADGTTSTVNDHIG